MSNGFVGTASPFYASEADGVLYLQSNNVRENKLDFSRRTFVTKEFHLAQSKSVLKSGDLLTVQSGHIGTTAVVDPHLAGANCHALIISRPIKEKLSSHFAAYLLNYYKNSGNMDGIFIGSTIKHVNVKDLKRLDLVVPSIEEQHQIAAALVTVDNKLDVLARQITATQALKQGLMQTLFTNGVGTQQADGRWTPHAEFKDSAVGPIPAAWSVSAIGEALAVVERPVVMQDGHMYRRVTVKRRHGGVELRDELLGGEIKIKSQFELDANDFLISERQIVHGACGIVPAHLAGALVSNEYLVLRANEHVDVSYVNYLVQLLKYSKLFMLCAQGVDIEKFLFKPKDWLKKLIPLPPLHEQQRIAQILSTTEKKIAAMEARHAQYQTLKRGLMQKLLTGEWRVKVNDTNT